MPTEHSRTKEYSRWEAAVALLVILLLVTLVPRSVRALPEWVVGLLAIVVLLPLVVNGLRKPTPFWLRAEQVGIRVYFYVSAPATMALVGALIWRIVQNDSALSGLELLVTSSALWLTNLFSFAIVYWHIDCGGPAHRADEHLPRPDWLFTEYTLPSQITSPEWRPSFLDYAYLSFWTASCFSAADIAPITRRAKVLMMIEVAISLTTVLIVVSRAINTLAS